MNIESTAKGAYLASLLVCLPTIESVSANQDLNLHAMSFDADESPSDSNSFSSCMVPLYNHIFYLHDRASSYDRSLSLLVLDKIPSSDKKIPGLLSQRISVYKPSLSMQEQQIPY